MKSCESCIFAQVTHGQFKTVLEDGTVLTQNTGNTGVSYVCQRPGGVNSISFDGSTGAMTCFGHRNREAKSGDE